LANRNVRITILLFEAAAQILVTAIDGTGSAFALYEIVAVLGFNFVATEIAAYGVFDNHMVTSFKMHKVCV
jgi:hypothetical protein